MKQTVFNLLSKENPLYFIVSEFCLGFIMAIGAFHILPLSFEISGLATALLGTVAGVFLVFLLKRFFPAFYCWRFLFCTVVVIIYWLFPVPFYSYLGNGWYLAILAGVLLFVQIQYLSLEQKKIVFKKSLDLWYIAGLLLGILLK